MSNARRNVDTLAHQNTASDPGDPGGFWPDLTPAVAIHRNRQRIFVGDGAEFTGNRSGSQGGFVPTSAEGANWVPRDSLGFYASERGLVALAGFSSNTQIDPGPGPAESIGVAGFVINAAASAKRAWGLYSDLQHESGALESFGLEVGAKNKGSNITGTPYGIGNGVEGVRLVAGGDSSYGGAPTNPSKAALVVVGNSGQTWNDGIVFVDGSLTKSGGLSRAVAMGVGARLFWYQSNTTKGFAIRSVVDTPGTEHELIAQANSLILLGANSKAHWAVSLLPNAVNYLDTRSGTVGSSPSIIARGDDTNINVELQGKGVSGVRLLDGAGALKFLINTNGISFFGGSAQAQSTAWGTPTGAAKVANFPGATATLLQTSQTLAQLIADLKAFGLLAT